MYQSQKASKSRSHQGPELAAVEGPNLGNEICTWHFPESGKEEGRPDQLLFSSWLLNSYISLLLQPWSYDLLMEIDRGLREGDHPWKHREQRISRWGAWFADWYCHCLRESFVCCYCCVSVFKVHRIGLIVILGSQHMFSSLIHMRSSWLYWVICLLGFLCGSAEESTFTFP